jgi:pimeloyl-ACP methyl ester carboxylesterase
VLVQTALTADELRPLADQPGLRNGYRRILYHRRGYAGSSPVQGPGSIARDAADCQALLNALGIERAHVVGLSYSAAVVLQLAVDAPNLVHSLTLLEPPPVHVPSTPEFRAICTLLQATRHAHGPTAALDEFAALVFGPDWWVAVERDLPGATAQMQRAPPPSSTPTSRPCWTGRSPPPTPGASPPRCCTSAAPTAGHGSPRSAS